MLLCQSNRARTAVVLQVVEVDVRVAVHLHLVAVAHRDARDVAGVLRAQPAWERVEGVRCLFVDRCHCGRLLCVCTYVTTACRTAVEARSSRVWPRERMTKGMASSSIHTREEREGASEPYTWKMLLMYLCSGWTSCVGKEA